MNIPKTGPGSGPGSLAGYFDSVRAQYAEWNGLNEGQEMNRCEAELRVRSNDDFFAALAAKADTVTDPLAPNDEKLRAGFDMFAAIDVWPDSTIRTIASLAYGQWAISELYNQGFAPWDYDHDKRIVHFRSDAATNFLARRIPGYEAYYQESWTAQHWMREVADVRFEELFNIAAVLNACGRSSLNRLMREFNIYNLGAYPATILIDQLQTNLDEVREVPIFASHELAAAAPDQSDLYENIAKEAASTPSGGLTVIREFTWDEDFFDLFTEPKDPIVGFINGHGNWDNIGGIDMDVVDSKRRKLNAPNWKYSGGVALLGCRSADEGYIMETDKEPASIARSFAKLTGRPAVGFDGMVTKVTVGRKCTPKKDEWSVIFHEDAKGRVRGSARIIEPQNPTRIATKVMINASSI